MAQAHQTGAQEPSAPEAVRPRLAGGGHVAALDGVRGIAIILVLLFHYGANAAYFGFSGPLLKATGFGWLGVDLFFVLSGFLITGILWDAREKARYFRNFYARRALRIFPLYYLALAIVVALSLLWPEAGVWGKESPLYIAFYATNFLIPVTGDQATGILSHFWSLAVEEHFYLFWPLVVFFLSRRNVMLAAIGMVLVAMITRVVLAKSGNPVAAYMVTPARMDALAIGAFFALAVRGPGGLQALVKPAWILAALTAPALLALVIHARETSELSFEMQSLGYTVFSLLSGAGIIIGLTFRPLNGLLSLAPLRWFGKYSYGLYVWHPIVNVILYYTSITTAIVGLIGPMNLYKGAFMIVLGFSITVCISLASYHFYEKRFLELKSRFAPG